MLIALAEQYVPSKYVPKPYLPVLSFVQRDA